MATKKVRLFVRIRTELDEDLRRLYESDPRTIGKGPYSFSQFIGDVLAGYVYDSGKLRGLMERIDELSDEGLD